MHGQSSFRSSLNPTRHTQDCAAICLQTIQYCLEQGGEHTEPTHMQLLLDCADICQTTAAFAARRSQNHVGVTSACADICDLCASACEKFQDDPQMKACANQCFLCAAACRQMVSFTAAHAGLHGAQAGVGAQVSAPAAQRQPRGR